MHLMIYLNLINNNIRCLSPAFNPLQFIKFAFMVNQMKIHVITGSHYYTSFLDDDNNKYTSKDLGDYDTEYYTLDDKNSLERYDKERDVKYNHPETSAGAFWLKKQIQKANYPSNGIDSKTSSYQSNGDQNINVYLQRNKTL